jgi:hypothetical protein
MDVQESHPPEETQAVEKSRSVGKIEGVTTQYELGTQSSKEGDSLDDKNGNESKESNPEEKTPEKEEDAKSIDATKKIEEDVVQDSGNEE